MRDPFRNWTPAMFREQASVSTEKAHACNRDDVNGAALHFTEAAHWHSEADRREARLLPRADGKEAPC